MKGSPSPVSRMKGANSDLRPVLGFQLALRTLKNPSAHRPTPTSDMLIGSGVLVDVVTRWRIFAVLEPVIVRESAIERLSVQFLQSFAYVLVFADRVSLAENVSVNAAPEVIWLVNPFANRL